MTIRTRGRNGRYARSLPVAQRDAEAAQLRTCGTSYREIAEPLGYASKGAAHDGVGRALAAVPADAVEQLRVLERARLDRLTPVAWGCWNVGTRGWATAGW